MERYFHQLVSFKFLKLFFGRFEKKSSPKWPVLGGLVRERCLTIFHQFLDRDFTYKPLHSTVVFSWGAPKKPETLDLFT